MSIPEIEDPNKKLLNQNVAAGMPVANAASPTPTQNFDTFANIGKSDLQTAWQKMYDNEAAKTQKQNAQQTAAATRNAAQQAAIGGYNPAAGARLQDMLMANANRANQGRNENLQSLNLQTQTNIANDQDQRKKSAIEEIMRINPNAGAAALRAYNNGGDINAALQPFYGPDGQIKAYTEAEQATDAQKKQTAHYLEVFNKGDKSPFVTNYLLANLSMDEILNTPGFLDSLDAGQKKQLEDRMEKEEEKGGGKSYSAMDRVNDYVNLTKPTNIFHPIDSAKRIGRILGL